MRVTVRSVVVLVFALVLPARAEAAKIRKGPYLQDLTDSSVVIRAEVDPPSAATVEVFKDRKLTTWMHGAMC